MQLNKRKRIKEHLPHIDDEDLFFEEQQQHPQYINQTIIKIISTIKNIKYIKILGKYLLISL